MAWLSMSPHTSDENTRTCWNYTFQWTPIHKTAAELEPLKYTYDGLADRVLDRLDDIWPPDIVGEIPRGGGEREREKVDDEVGLGGGVKENGKGRGKKRDLYELLKENWDKEGEDVLREFWEGVHRVPEWVDWAQIERGQNVFYRYGGVMLTALAYQSLLGGMGAGRVTEVLSRTSGFSLLNSRKRIYETTQHILQCTLSLPSIQPGGSGHISTLRVRLLHALVRKRILLLARSRPSYYSVFQHGIPINDLDSIGTIATFSSTLIWLGIPRQGIWLREKEIEDYIALWRLIAYYIGSPDGDYYSSPVQAKAIMESILIVEMVPNAMSKVLANNIIDSLAGQAPAYASREFLEASARWLNGNDLCDALGLGKPGMYYWVLVAGQCAFFSIWCWVKRHWEWLDRKSIEALRKMLYRSIVTHPTFGLGAETDFAFQYIPALDVITSQGISEKSGFAVRGAERRNLMTLVMGSVVAGGVCWVWIRTLRVFWRLVGG